MLQHLLPPVPIHRSAVGRNHLPQLDPLYTSISVVGYLVESCPRIETSDSCIRPSKFVRKPDLDISARKLVCSTRVCMMLAEGVEEHGLTALIVFKLHEIPFSTPAQRMETDRTASYAALDDSPKVPSALITDMTGFSKPPLFNMIDCRPCISSTGRHRADRLSELGVDERRFGDPVSAGHVGPPTVCRGLACSTHDWAKDAP